MLDFLAVAAANLRVRRLRTGFTVFGVAVAVASFIALYTLARGPERNWQRSLNELGAHLIGYERGSVHIIASHLPADLENRIGGVPGVAAVTPQISRFVPIDDEQRQMVLVGAPVPSKLWRDVPLRSGRLPNPGETWVVILGGTAADALGKGVGDTIQLMWRPFEVIGISAFENPMNSAGILAPLAALRELDRSTTSVSAFVIHLGDPGNAKAVSETMARLNALTPELIFVRTEDVARSSQVLQLLQAISWVISVIAVGMGVLAVANTLVMAITERTREIGVLSAVGWSASRIAALILIESLLVTVAGCLLGVVSGVALALWMGDHPVLSGLLQPVFSVELFVWIGVAMLAIGLLGGAYPAWVASRVDPARALQHE